ncbi:hypothetical protein AJ80_07032 [Polytolypa hystricis UAMH7299]|uniref:Uncharacterized protein n=1 Tax=Polytolypa hystricis (strain UAMH7299) TaxID=1447883 RepID=A0A2B7XRT8_POLH7|nr:hypothetical protein AJ80_07032 [Polytolypa hystricis UAMH7299]
MDEQVRKLRLSNAHSSQLASSKSSQSSPMRAPSARSRVASKRLSDGIDMTDDVYLSSHMGSRGKGATPSSLARTNTDPHRLSAGYPSSSFDIQTQTPPRASDASGLVNPTSALLQGLIKEQRASRSSRRTTGEHVTESQLQTPPPPTAPSQDGSTSEKRRRVSDALSAGLKQPQNMGMREMDQYVSNLNKLNFDLKLEIFHRAQQMAVMKQKLERMQYLEEQLERMEGMEEELQELQQVEENNQVLRESNEHLRREIDKRDQAINEAVELICQLEAKVDSLEPSTDADELSTARPHTSEGLASPKPSLQELTPRTRIVVDVPDRTSSRKGTSSGRRSRAGTPSSSARRPRRQPSFLRNDNGSTSALRSLYTSEDNKSRGAFSILSGDEPPEPESPRLSILSECSYLDPSTTPSKPRERAWTAETQKRNFTLPPAARPEEFTQNTNDDDDKLERIDRWVQPPQDVFLDTISKPERRISNAKSASKRASSKQPSLDTAFQAKRSTKYYKLDSPRMEGSMFNGGRLPPTPDTMSTNPDGRGGSNSSVIAEKSRLDQGNYYPSFITDHTPRRPRSADDITTRPSSANSMLSDAVETLSDATQLGLNGSDRNHLASMFPSFTYTPSGPFRDPRFPIDNTDMLRTMKSISSLRSSTSEPHSRQHHLSDSPPLTPQDWLEAALPADNPANRKSKRHSAICSHLEDEASASLRPASTSTEAVEGTPKQKTRHIRVEEPDLPQSIMQLRPAGSSPQMQPQRRRITLRPRFFSRSSSHRETTPMSDSAEKDVTPSPATSHKNRHRSGSHRRALTAESVPDAAAVLGSDAPNGRETPKKQQNKTIAPRTSVSTALSRSGSTRPLTSDGSDYKRRTSMGLFGWMKGATSGLGSSPATPRDIDTHSSSPVPPASAGGATVTPLSPDMGSKTAPIAINDNSRVNSSHQHRAPRPLSSFIAGTADAAALDPAYTSVPDESPDWKSKFQHRRSRKAG